MATDKSSVALTRFFSTLFSNFPKLLLTNLIFAVPVALIFAVFWGINSLSGMNSNLILFLSVIPIFPFYAGVTQVVSHIVRGEKDVDVFRNFLLGVKENFLRFLVHGIIFYFAIVFSFFSISLYIENCTKNSIFYAFLATSIVIAVFFLFAFFYIPPMTVTFDLKMKHIYKNSALMTFGEIKRNLLALFGLLVLALVCATVLFCSFNELVVIIATIVLALFFVPSIMSFIINSAVYNGMYNMITGKGRSTADIDKKIENRKKGQFFDEDEAENNDIQEDFSAIDLDETKDENEFIFYNGKMIKRGVLIKMKKEAEEKTELAFTDKDKKDVINDVK